MRRAKAVVLYVPMVFWATILGGCASTKSPVGNSVELSQSRSKIETVQHIDQQRELAEFQAAVAQWEQGDLAEASHRLRALLTRNPDHLEARLLLADVLLSQNQPEEALGVLQVAASPESRDARVAHTMGLLLDALGKHEEAKAWYQKAAQLEPDNEVYQVCYQEAVREEGSGTRGVPAPPPLENSSSLSSPGNAGPPAVVARFIDPVESDDPSGQKDFGDQNVSSLQGSRSDEEELLSRATQALAEEHPELAKAYLERAISDQPNDPQLPIRAAVAVLRYNHPEIASDILQQAIGRFPQSAGIYRILGVAYYRQGNYHAAQQALSQALLLDKSSALSYFLMGCTLVKLGQTAAAEPHFRQARLMDPRFSALR